jgi:hypothetical protein
MGDVFFHRVVDGALRHRPAYLFEALPYLGFKLRHALLKPGEPSLYVAESDLKRTPCGGRRLADDLGGGSHGLGRQPDILAGLTDFFPHVALLFRSLTVLLGLLAVCLGLLPMLF